MSESRHDDRHDQALTDLYQLDQAVMGREEQCISRVLTLRTVRVLFLSIRALIVRRRPGLFMVKSLLVLLVPIASAIATSALELREPRTPLSACQATMDCEVSEEVDGSRGTRFMEGMEPNSEFVQALEPNAPAAAAGRMVKRWDPSCDRW